MVISGSPSMTSVRLARIQANAFSLAASAASRFSNKLIDPPIPSPASNAVALKPGRLLEHLAKAAFGATGSFRNRSHSVELADNNVHGDLQTCKDR
jgi:hypothetical protein